MPEKGDALAASHHIVIFILELALLNFKLCRGFKLSSIAPWHSPQQLRLFRLEYRLQSTHHSDPTGTLSLRDFCISLCAPRPVDRNQRKRIHAHGERHPWRGSADSGTRESACHSRGHNVNTDNRDSARAWFANPCQTSLTYRACFLPTRDRTSPAPLDSALRPQPDGPPILFARPVPSIMLVAPLLGPAAPITLLSRASRGGIAATLRRRRKADTRYLPLRVCLDNTAHRRP